jgi:catechol 2,3-dioxygenase-like lactoylglutathione lyase family enzyme
MWQLHSLAGVSRVTLEGPMLGSHKIVAFIQITNLEKARAFYEGVLGLRFVKDDGFAAIFDANGIMVRAAKMKEFTPLQSTVLGWEVAKIDEIVRALQKKGVHFEIFGFFKQDELGIWTAPTGDKVAWFKDPEGNILSLSQHV